MLEFKEKEKTSNIDLNQALEAKKESLFSKSTQLAKIKLDLDKIRNQISVTERTSREDEKLKNEIIIKKEEKNLIVENRKANFLKDLNIKKNNLQICGNSQCKFDSKIDNLIKCLLDLADNKYSRFNLIDDNQSNVANELNVKQIQELKSFLLIDSNTKINQELVNILCNKISEKAKVKLNNQCVLLENYDKDELEDKIIIYEFNSDYLILIKETEQKSTSVLDKSHQIINNLLHEELLEDLCRLTFYVLSGFNDLQTTELDKLYTVLKDIKKLDENLEDGQEESEFLSNLIKLVNSRQENLIIISELILNDQLKELTKYYNQLEQYTPEHDSLKLGIDFLKLNYLKRMEFMLFCECERRKKLAELNIKSDILSGNEIEQDMNRIQNELDTLNQNLEIKKADLTKKISEIGEKSAQIEQLNESLDKQNVQLDKELVKLREELSKKENEMLKTEHNVNEQHNKLSEKKKEINELNSKIDELETNKTSLKNKKKEAEQTLENLHKEKLKMELEKNGFEVEKESKEKEKKKVEKTLEEFRKWTKFIENIYNELLNNQSLFEKRLKIKEKLDTADLFNQYSYLTEQTELSKYKDNDVKEMASRNNDRRREELLASLNKILAEPNVAIGRDKNNNTMIELTAININYSEIEPFISNYIRKELKKMNFTLSKENYLTTNDKESCYRHFLNLESNSNSSEEINDLIDNCIKTTYLIEQKDLSQAKRLGENTSIDMNEKSVKLGDIKMEKLLEDIKVPYERILRCYAQTVKILAGNNVYTNKNEIKLNGINLCIQAGQNIYFPIGFQIDTSGLDGLKFKINQAYSNNKKVNQLKAGQDGLDGLDGLAGDNGGHIYLKAEKHILNLESISLLNSQGGKGGVGQKGGKGQDGGRAADIGDAQAEDFGYCIFRPGFSIAFAREPGYNPKTDQFDDLSELSGNGGNAGRAGFGGQGGFAGKIIIKDSSKWIKNKTNVNNENDSLVCSDNLNELIAKLINEKNLKINSGETAEHGNLSVEGGKAGPAGTFGRDNVIYVSGIRAKRQNKLGDYSNYLDKPSLDKSGVKHYSEKHSGKSILDDPDFYGVQSPSYKYVRFAAYAVGLIAAALAVPFVLTTVVGTVIGPSLAMLTTSVSPVFAGIFGCGLLMASYSVYTSIGGISVETRSKEKLRSKNHLCEVKFNNRYCDYEPLRNEELTSEYPRVSLNSKGQNGNKSKLKEESEREEHSKSSETQNLFADLVEQTELSQKVNDLKVDKQKNEIIEHLNGEIKAKTDELVRVETEISQTNQQLTELGEKSTTLNSKIEENEELKKQLETKLNEVDKLLNKQSSELNQAKNELLQSLDIYINEIEKQFGAHIEIDLARLKEKNKQEVKNELKKCFLSIKSKLEEENQTLVRDKQNILQEIESKELTKANKEQEIEALRRKALETNKSRALNEQIANEANQMQKRLSQENASQKKLTQTQEVVQIKEFNTSNNQNEKKSNKNNSQQSVKLDLRQINKKDYTNLFSSFRLGYGYPKIDDLLTAIHNNDFLDKNISLGQLEFIIYAYKHNLYKKIQPNINDKKLTEVYEPKQLFNEIKSKPLQLDLFYQNIVKYYFKFIPMDTNKEPKEITIENCLNELSPNLRYIQAEDEQLDKDIIWLVSKSEEIFDTKVNHMKLTKLIADYKNRIDQIESLKYSALKVLDGSVNKFYKFLLQTLLNSNLNWFNLNDMFHLLDLINKHIEEINQSKLWPNLLKHQVKDSFKNVSYCKTTQLELVQLENQNLNSQYKLKLIEEYLQPNLIKLLRNEFDLNQFKQIKDLISKSNVNDLKDKESVEFKIKTKTTLNERKRIGMSENGFIAMYGLSSPFNYASTLDSILKHSADNLLVQKMLNDYLFLIENKKILPYSDLIDILKQLSQKKANQIDSLVNHLNRLILVISKSCESLLKSKINHKDFDLVLSEITKNRFHQFKYNLNELCERKHALYSILNEIISKENEINSTMIVSYVINGNLAPTSLLLTEVQIDFLNKLTSSKITAQMSAAQIYEDILFSIGEMQCKIFESLHLIQSDDSNEEAKTQAQKLTTKLMSRIELIQKTNISTVLIDSIKIFAQNINDKLQEERLSNELLKYCQLGKETQFIKELDNLANSKNKVNLIRSILNSNFQTNWLEHNRFLQSLINQESQHTNDFVELTELNELVKEKQFEELFSYLQFTQLKNKTEKKIQQTFTVFSKEINQNISLLDKLENNSKEIKSCYDLIKSILTEIDCLNLKDFQLVLQFNDYLIQYKKSKLTNELSLDHDLQINLQKCLNKSLELRNPLTDLKTDNLLNEVNLSDSRIKRNFIFYLEFKLKTNSLPSQLNRFEEIILELTSPKAEQLLENELVNNLKEELKNIQTVFSTNLDQFNELKLELVSIYKNKLEAKKSNLFQKGKVNFYSELIHKLHTDLTSKVSLKELNDLFSNLKKEFEAKTYQEIDAYLIDKINDSILNNIEIIVEDYKEITKEYPIKNGLELSDLFRFIFGDDRNKGVKCLFSDLINNIFEFKQENFAQLDNQFDLIEIMLKNFYFNNFNQQDTIEELRQELLASSEKLTDSELNKKVCKLNHLLIKSCFKINNCIKYVDQRDGPLRVNTHEYDLNDLLKQIKNLFNDITLINCKENLKLPKAALTQKCVNGLTDFKSKIESLSSRELNQLVKNISHILKDYKTENKFQNCETISKRDKLVNILDSFDAKQILKEIKLADLNILTIEQVKDFQIGFENKISSFLNGLLSEQVNFQNHLTKIIKNIYDLNDFNVEFYVLVYICHLCEEEKTPTIKYFDSKSLELFSLIYSEAEPTNFINNFLDSLITTRKQQSQLEIRKLSFILRFVSLELVDLNKLKQAIKLNKVSIEINILLITFYHENSTSNDLLDRVYNSIKANESNDAILFYLNLNEKVKLDKQLLENFDFFKANILLNEEKLYVDYLDKEIVEEIILTKPIHLWEDYFENEFVSSKSKLILKEEILNFYPNLLDELVKTTYFDECEVIFDKLNESLSDETNIADLKLIKTFKTNLFISKELNENRFKWLALISLIQEKKSLKELSLQNVNDILETSYLFTNLDNLMQLIKTEKGEDLNKTLLIEALQNILNRLFNSPENIVNILDQLKQNINSSDTFNLKYVKTIIERCLCDLKRGLKYKPSEMNLFSKIVSCSIQLGVHLKENEFFLTELKSLSMLKWINVLRREQLKYELNRDDPDLINDLITIEKLKGNDLFRRLVDLIKNNEIEDTLLKYIVKQFKKNIWELNNPILDLLTQNANNWIQTITEYNETNKKKDLSVADLIDLMKSLEEAGEINHYIKSLLDRTNGLSVLEECLKQIKATTISVIRKDKNDKEIKDYTMEDIKEWTKEYKELVKANWNTILRNEIIELVVVISRASELVNKHGLRSTQMLSLLLFIDGILNKKGRLANISTGEGKSLITITTAIAQLLIRGGTVDILTSSEVLAERDSEESKDLFAVFDLSVSNNCDVYANANEQLRKQRYEQNEVIYGEIGHFQRDLLLTKYYEKDLRKNLATCLIVDEVDSMCIDNICNTLYISHQISDLNYLKDIYCYIWQAVNTNDVSSYSSKNVQLVRELIEDFLKNKQIRVPKNLNAFIQRRLSIWIANAYMAKENIHEGNHYSIMSKGKKFGQAVINDLQTGVEQLNTQWSEGLQQFIQIKHTNKLSEESLKAIFMSNYIFFTQYGSNIFGMTGTLGASLERDLLAEAYSLDFFQLPRFKRELNVRDEDKLMRNRSEWLQAIKNEVREKISTNRLIESNEINEAQANRTKLENKLNELNEKIKDKSLGENDLKEINQQIESKQLDLQCLNDLIGDKNEEERNRAARPVLIICENKRDVNDIVKVLLLNTKHLYDYTGKIDGLRRIESGNQKHSSEIKQLRPGDVIVATNVAGRGTDFKLGQLVEKNGGLHVIISYVPNNIRVELQGFGRSGRKGESGSGCMISYDSRANQADISIEYLKDERDKREEERIHDIRIKMIPRVKIERELFEKFDSLQTEVKKFYANEDIKYRDIQTKALHNKWALWLDEMSSNINNVYKTDQNRTNLFSEFNRFESRIKSEHKRDFYGLSGLIDEPGELIKLAKYNIEKGNFNSAIANCDYIISEFGDDLSPFAYYYKALAICQPMTDLSSFEMTQAIEKKFKARIITYEEKLQAVKLLKQATILFENEIAKLQQRSNIIARLDKAKQKSGIGTSSDYLSKSSANEIAVIQIHLNAAKSAYKQEIQITDLAHSLDNTCIVKNEQTNNKKRKSEDSVDTDKLAQEIFENIIKDESIKSRIKSERLSKKLKVRYHVLARNKDLLKDKLDANTYEQGVLNTKKYLNDSNDQLDFIIIDQLSNSDKKTLKENGIHFYEELYIKEILNDNYKHIEYPSSMYFSKIKVLNAIKTKTSLTERENAIEHITQTCLNSNKIWEHFQSNVGLEEVECFVLNEKKSQQVISSDELWKLDIFKSKGQQIKMSLLEEFTKKDHLELKELNILLKKETNNESNESIINKLKEEQFMNSKILNRFTKSALIEKTLQEIELKENIQQEKFDYIVEDFNQLQAKKKPLFDLFLKCKNDKKKITKEDITLVLKQSDEEQDVIEAHKAFNFLRKQLEILDLTYGLSSKLQFKSNHFDFNELIEIDLQIEMLNAKKYFVKEDIELESIEIESEKNSLITYFKSEKVIKGKAFKQKLKKGPESIAQKAKADLVDSITSLHTSTVNLAKTQIGMQIDEDSEDLVDSITSLHSSIEVQAKKQIERLVDKQIDEGYFLSETQLNQLYKSHVKKYSTWNKTLNPEFLISSAGLFIIQNMPGVDEKDLNKVSDAIDKMSEAQIEDLLRIWHGADFKKIIKKKLLNDEREKEIENLTKLVTITLMKTIGALSLNEMSFVEFRKLEDYFKGSNLPLEASEYIQQHKDLVIAFSKYQSPWCWKAFAVAMFGLIQITVGALLMAYPVLGPVSFHLGSALISEGVGDITYAIQNAGQITGMGYLKRKETSLAITVLTVGVGAYLSRGASAINVTSKVFKEQAAKLGIKLATKEGAVAVARSVVAKTVIKKIVGEVVKGLLNVAQSMAANLLTSLSSVFINAIFQEFRNVILSMIQMSPAYKRSISSLRSNVNVLEKTLREKLSGEKTNQIVEEKLDESEQELNETINNKLASLVRQIGGPLSSQIKEAAGTVQYSGLLLDGENLSNEQNEQNLSNEQNEQNLSNEQSNNLAKIASVISDGIAIVKKLNTAYDLVTCAGEMVESVDHKIENKIEVLNEIKSTANISNETTSTEVKEANQFTVIRDNKSEISRNIFKKYDSNETEIDQEQEQEKLEDNIEVNRNINIVNDRVLNCIRKKIENNVVNPAFNALLSHALKPVYQKLEEKFCKDFEQLKKRALAYGEYSKRYDKNKEEKGLELEKVKDFLQSELDSFKFESPVKVYNLADLKKGKITLQIDGELKTLDLGNKEDRDLIRDKIGSMNMRILPGTNVGDELRLSRPNFPNYVKAWDPNKKVNEHDLKMIAEKTDRPIKIYQKNEKGEVTEKVIGPDNGKEPLCLNLNKGETESSNHFIPMVNKNGQMFPVENLPNVGNACGIESILYSLKREEILKNGGSEEDANSKAIDYLNQPNSREKFIDSIKDFALNNKELRNKFLDREHEASDNIGGVKLTPAQRINNDLDKNKTKHEIGGKITRCVLNNLTPKEKEAKIIEKDKKIRELIGEHCFESIDQLKKYLALLDELRKSYPEEAFVVKGAHYQDMDGIKGRNAAVDSSSYDSCKVNLSDKKLSDCTSVAAAHLLGFNLVNLPKHLNPEHVEVYHQMVNLLSKTNYLPELYNGGPDQTRDHLFREIVKGFIKDKDQTVDQAMKHLYKKADEKLSTKVKDSTDLNKKQMLNEIQFSFKKHEMQSSNHNERSFNQPQKKFRQKNNY